MSASTLDRQALERLAARLATGRVEARPLSGGASQDLWLLTIGAGRFVMRRTPAAGRSGLAIPIALEADLLEAAAASGVPTPRVALVLSPEDGLGEGYVMEFVEGEALGQRIVRDPAFAPVRPSLAGQCGAILARIHALPGASFEDLPHAQASDVLAVLRNAYEEEDWPRPVFELAFRWLEQNAPAPAAPVVVHGDFRNGNLLIGPDGVRAVLDWELAHLGDPAEDFAWICVNSWRFGEIDKPVGGFGEREALYESYEAAGGAPVDRARVRYWEVLGTLRWGVICTMSGVALKAGGPAPVERAMIARRASETELDLLDLLESA